MSEQEEVDLTDLAHHVVRAADELRALSNAGLMFTDDPYQVERYRRIIEIAAALTSRIDRRPMHQLRQIYFQDMEYITPYTVVETVLFDDQGRLLLIQRADTERWALPGGACEVGEAAATAAMREAWEETGCVVAIDRLLGIFDSRLNGDETIHHLYIMLFCGRVIGGAPRITRETKAIRWFHAGDIPWEALHGRHDRRIRQALAWLADPSISTHFDRESWQPVATFQHENDQYEENRHEESRSGDG